MIKSSQKIFKEVLKIYDQDGGLTKVGPQYYQAFVNCPGKEMEVIIACIVHDRADFINKNISNGKWRSDKEIFEFVTLNLEMIALGILEVREKDLRIVFTKPVGIPPDKNMERKLDEKIKKSIPLIKKMVLRMLQGSLEKKDLDNIVEKGINKGKFYASPWHTGVMYDQLGFYEKAIDIYGKMIELEPDRPEGWRAKGALLEKLGSLEEALEGYSKVIALKPDDINVYYNKGLILCKLKRYKDALAIFDKAIEKAPNDFYSCWFKSYALFMLGDYQETIMVCDRAIKLKSDDASIYVNKGWALYELGFFNKSLEAFNKALKIMPSDMNIWRYKGFLLGKARFHKEALKSFDTILKLDPDDVHSLVYKGLALSALNHHEEADKARRKAFDLNAALVLQWTLMRDRIFKLTCYREVLTLKAYDKLIETNPDDADPWLIKGDTALWGMSTCRFFNNEALEAFNKSIELEPYNAVAWYSKGYVLCNLKRYEEALGFLVRATKQNPDFLEAWISKGKALFRLGQYDEAQKAFNQAIELNTDDPYVRDQIALICSLKGDKENA